MAEEETTEIPVKTRWAISSDWFIQNNRSIIDLLRNYLCPECARKFDIESKKKSHDVLFTNIHNCCSHSTNFISEKLPLLEAIFRFLLSNGNTPVTTEELTEQLSLVQSGNAYRNSPEILVRVLKGDQYYGLCELTSSDNS